MEEREYSVSEAVRLIGVESHVLRYWEEELGVAIKRTNLGHRVYSEQNIALFRRVKGLKEQGIQLKAIRLLLDGEGQAENVTPISAKCAEKRQASGNSYEMVSEVVRDLRLLEDKTTSTDEKSSAEDGEESGEKKIMEDEKESENKDAAEETAEFEREDTVADAAEAELYEVVYDEKEETLRRFEAMLRRLMAETAEEQSDRLVHTLTDALRGELEDWYLQALQEAAGEAAAARSKEREERGLRGLIGKLFQRKK